MHLGFASGAGLWPWRPDRAAHTEWEAATDLPSAFLLQHDQDLCQGPLVFLKTFLLSLLPLGHLHAGQAAHFAVNSMSGWLAAGCQTRIGGRPCD